MELFYDIVKTWYSNNKESKEKKKEVLLAFRAFFKKITVEIDVSRINDQYGQMKLTDLKFEIPRDTKLLADLTGRHEVAMDIGLVKIIEDYQDKMVKICQEFNTLHMGSPICDDIEDLYKMSKNGKEEIDRVLQE
jgi:hypothetical protein